MATAIENVIVSPEDYIEAEKTAEIRHEFANGFVYAQAGASRIHNLLAVSFARELSQHLKGTPCRTYIADMKVRIKTADLDLFYYPDVMISCDQKPPHDYYEDQPKLIIEILSDTTESRDRLEKLNAYTQLPSLHEYMLVSQKRAEVDIYRRKGNGLSLERFIETEVLDLQSVDFQSRVIDLYADVLGIIDR